MPHLQEGSARTLLAKTMNYRMKELLEAIVIGICIFAMLLVWGCMIAGCRADRRMEQFAPRHGHQASLKGYSSYAVESSGGLKSVPTRGASNLSEGREPIPKTAAFPTRSNFPTLV